MEKLENIMGIMSSPLFGYVVKGFLIYLALLWLALVIWVARDIVNRTNNVLVQVFCILLNLVLPVFGLILYLVLRPPRTLLEKYYDEMEHEFFEELQQQDTDKSPAPARKTAAKKARKTPRKASTKSKKTTPKTAKKS